jgi:hypothetical protein
MLFSKPISITDALKTQRAKTVVAVAESIGSADIKEWPAEIRRRSFFSARTPFAEYLQDTSSLIQRLIQPDIRGDLPDSRPLQPGDSVNPATVRAAMKAHLQSIGYQPDPSKAGTLQDLSSDRRINLIIATQTQMAHGYGRHLQTQNPTTLSLYPADELYRAIRPRGQGRPWAARWNAARAASASEASSTLATDDTRGPFVALKNDPIWTALSTFGNPYPPFDYSSGMRVRNVPRARAIELGIFQPDQQLTPDIPPLNNNVETSVANLQPDLLQPLLNAFGSIAKLAGDVLTLIP